VEQVSSGEAHKSSGEAHNLSCLKKFTTFIETDCALNKY